MKTGTEKSRGGFRSLVAIAVAISTIAAGIAVPAASGAGGSSAEGLRALTPAQKKAKAKAIKKCKMIKVKAKRAACIKKVNKKYPSGSSGTPITKVWEVDLWDNDFVPNSLDIKANEAVNWIWRQAEREPHNVNPFSLPSGVNRFAFTSNSSGVVGTRFQRQFTVPGVYNFVCTFHALMSMQVRVTR